MWVHVHVCVTLYANVCVYSYFLSCPVGWGRRIRRLHLGREIRLLHPMKPFIGFGYQVTDSVIIHFSPYWDSRVVREAGSDQSGGHVKSLHLYDCPYRNLQDALVANKYPTLFYLKGAIRQWLIVNCVEMVIVETIQNVCKQMIIIK